MKKISFITTILLIFAISSICLSCVNSSGSTGASGSSSKPDITGRYEAADGDHFEFDCNYKVQLKTLCSLFNEDPNKYDGFGSFSYTITKDGHSYPYANLSCPFTIDGTKVTFDDSLPTVVTMSESYDSLTDSSGKTYTKTEKN